MLRKLSETIRVEMTLILLLSLLASALVAGATTNKWAYAERENAVNQSETYTDSRLKGYVSRDELYKVVVELKDEQHKSREQILDRINQVLLEVKKR